MSLTCDTISDASTPTIITPEDDIISISPSPTMSSRMPSSLPANVGDTPSSLSLVIEERERELQQIRAVADKESQRKLMELIKREKELLITLHNTSESLFNKDQLIREMDEKIKQMHCIHSNALRETEEKLCLQRINDVQGREREIVQKFESKLQQELKQLTNDHAQEMTTYQRQATLSSQHQLQNLKSQHSIELQAREQELQTEHNARMMNARSQFDMERNQLQHMHQELQAQYTETVRLHQVQMKENEVHKFRMDEERVESVRKARMESEQVVNNEIQQFKLASDKCVKELRGNISQLCEENIQLKQNLVESKDTNKQISSSNSNLVKLMEKQIADLVQSLNETKQAMLEKENQFKTRLQDLDEVRSEQLRRMEDVVDDLKNHCRQMEDNNATLLETQRRTELEVREKEMGWMNSKKKLRYMANKLQRLNECNEREHRRGENRCHDHKEDSLFSISQRDRLLKKFEALEERNCNLVSDIKRKEGDVEHAQKELRLSKISADATKAEIVLKLKERDKRYFRLKERYRRNAKTYTQERKKLYYGRKKALHRLEELEHVYGIDARRIGSADRLDSEFKTEAQPSGSFECNPSKQNASCFGMHDMRRENCQLKATLQALSTEMKRRLDEAGGKTNSGKDEHDIVKNSPNKQNEQNEVAALTSIIIRLKEKNKVLASKLKQIDRKTEAEALTCSDGENCDGDGYASTSKEERRKLVRDLEGELAEMTQERNRLSELSNRLRAELHRAGQGIIIHENAQGAEQDANDLHVISLSRFSYPHHSEVSCGITSIPPRASDRQTESQTQKLKRMNSSVARNRNQFTAVEEPSRKSGGWHYASERKSPNNQTRKVRNWNLCNDDNHPEVAAG